MKEFLNLFKAYMGNINEKDDEIVITALNTLKQSYNDELNGKIVFIKDKERKVECSISISKLTNAIYRISAEEKTYSIIGGFGATDNFEEILRYAKNWLEKLNFKKKGVEQLTLF